MPKSRKIFIVSTQTLATFARRGDRIYSSLLERLDERIAIISLIRKKVLGIYSLDKSERLRAICNGTHRNKHSNRPTIRIYGQMYTYSRDQVFKQNQL